MILRDVRDDDIDVLFEHWTDAESIRMAAFVPADQWSREAFGARMERIRSDRSATACTIEVEGDVVGTIGSFDNEGNREVTYWIGRAYWGQGFATEALRLFLDVESTRPLYGATAVDNLGSRRVLEKCGFRMVGTSRAFANGRGEDVDEVVLRLDT